MNDCFATRLVIGIFIAGVLLLAVFPLILPPFVGPLVGTMLITLSEYPNGQNHSQSKRRAIHHTFQSVRMARLFGIIAA